MDIYSALTGLDDLHLIKGTPFEKHFGKEIQKFWKTRDPADLAGTLRYVQGKRYAADFKNKELWAEIQAKVDSIFEGELFRNNLATNRVILDLVPSLEDPEIKGACLALLLLNSLPREALDPIKRIPSYVFIGLGKLRENSTYWAPHLGYMTEAIRPLVPFWIETLLPSLATIQGVPWITDLVATWKGNRLDELLDQELRQVRNTSGASTQVLNASMILMSLLGCLGQAFGVTCDEGAINNCNALLLGEQVPLYKSINDHVTAISGYESMAASNLRPIVGAICAAVSVEYYPRIWSTTMHIDTDPKLFADNTLIKDDVESRILEKVLNTTTQTYKEMDDTNKYLFFANLIFTHTNEGFTILHNILQNADVNDGVIAELGLVPESIDKPKPPFDFAVDMIATYGPILNEGKFTDKEKGNIRKRISEYKNVVIGKPNVVTEEPDAGNEEQSVVHEATWVETLETYYIPLEKMKNTFDTACENTGAVLNGVTAVGVVSMLLYYIVRYYYAPPKPVSSNTLYYLLSTPNLVTIDIEPDGFHASMRDRIVRGLVYNSTDVTNGRVLYTAHSSPSFQADVLRISNISSLKDDPALATLTGTKEIPTTLNGWLEADAIAIARIHLLSLYVMHPILEMNRPTSEDIAYLKLVNAGKSYWMNSANDTSYPDDMSRHLGTLFADDPGVISTWFESYTTLLQNNSYFHRQIVVDTSYSQLIDAIDTMLSSYDTRTADSLKKVMDLLDLKTGTTYHAKVQLIMDKVATKITAERYTITEKNETVDDFNNVLLDALDFINEDYVTTDGSKAENRAIYTLLVFLRLEYFMDFFESKDRSTVGQFLRPFYDRRSDIGGSSLLDMQCVSHAAYKDLIKLPPVMPGFTQKAVLFRLMESVHAIYQYVRRHKSGLFEPVNDPPAWIASLVTTSNLDTFKPISDTNYITPTILRQMPSLFYVPNGEDNYQTRIQSLPKNV